MSDFKKNILLTVATEFEIKPLIREFALSLNGNKTEFHKNKTHFDIFVTGIGMTKTALNLGKILAQNKYNLAVNVGIAGAFNKSLNLGDVVNVVSDTFSELGAEDGKKFISGHELKFIESNNYINSGVLINSNFPKFNSISTLPKVSGITVNTVHGDEESIQKITQQFNPDIESMEGAAFFYACLSEQIQCIQLRAISNYVERRNRDNWQLKTAIDNLNLLLFKVIDELTCQ